MKAELTIEQYDNGIGITWDAPTDEDQFPQKEVAKTGEEATAIGEQIWADVFNIFDKRDAMKVLIRLEYSIL